jgi:hypothetical protein
MTTFQYIIDGILSALAQIIPLSDATLNEFERDLLGWGPTTHELFLLVTFMGVLNFLFFFRYDWLGLTSGFLKSVIRPISLKPSLRTLDQHTVLFLLIIVVPNFLAHHFVTPLIRDNELLMHFGVFAFGSIVIAGLFQFAANWNKRLKGLNHVALPDAVFISALSLLSLHPSIPLVAMLWAGFAIRNYHYEAVFKFSMIIVGLEVFVHFIQLFLDIPFKTALQSVGYLNSIAVLVTTFTVFWIALENLQKGINEGTLRFFKWLHILFALGLIAMGVFTMMRGT